MVKQKGRRPAEQTKLMMPGDSQTWLSLIQRQLSWYSLMELADVYKLLYQGVMGPEHMVATQQEFSRRLLAEFEAVPPDQKQMVLESIRPDQALYRLNLKAYKARHSSVEPLIPAMLATIKLIAGTLDELRIVWADFIQWCRQGRIAKFKPANLDEYNNWLVEQGFPTVHHSEAYNREYKPAYRLVASTFIEELGLGDAG
jgi:hypothetical protein